MQHPEGFNREAREGIVKERAIDWLLLSAMPLLVAGMTLLLSVAG